MPVPFNIKSLALAPLLFIGYDLLTYTNGAGTNTKLTPMMLTGIFVFGLLAILWGLAAYLYVSPENLADTTLPHILTAKKIGGQAGRVIIGMVIISGTCAAVNVLIYAVSRMLTQMAANRLLPAIFTRFPSRPIVSLSCLAGAIGLLMAIGFAGSDLLDKSIRAGSFFWLLNYAITQLALFIQWRKKHSPHQRPRSPYWPKLHMVVFLAMSICSVGLVLSDDNIALLLLTMSVIFIISLFMAILGLQLAQSSFANREPKRI
jgi:amino acid transporter